MPEENGNKSGSETKITVEIGGEEKQFSAEDIANLHAQQSSATQKTQEVAAIKTVMDKYGVDASVLADQVDGVFGIMSNLIDKGVIDEAGQLVQKEPAKADPEIPPVVPPKETPPTSKADEVALKGLVSPLVEEIKALRNDNTVLMRLRLQDKAQEKFPDLTEDDVSKVFAVAGKDRAKSFMEHAKELNETKATEKLDWEKKFAEKHGINLEEVKAQKAFEQDPIGGAATMFGEKKFSFKPDKEGKSIDPVRASREFLGRALKG